MKVQIKTWDEMAKEFGVDDEGYIECDCLFTPDMEKEISEYNKDRIIEIERPYDDVDLLFNDEWVITADMIKRTID
jgi:hypothetical protein